MKVHFFLLIFATFTLVTFPFCDSSDDYGNNDDDELGDPPSAKNAFILINGNNVTGNTISDPRSNDRLKLRARFTDPQGNDTIQGAFARYAHHGGMMMQHMGEYTLWDDGTHGDDVPHDGWYCLEGEFDHMMSMMGTGWGHHYGEHEYEFYCYDEDGYESNRIRARLYVQ